MKPNPMRVLLLGAGGQLGMQLARRLAGEVELAALTRAQVDLSSADAVRAAVRNSAAEIVINAAAYTAVDKAESEPELALAVNATAPGVIAEEVARTGRWLIHYSTDYVFDGSGTSPWVETDATGPLNIYGQSKLDGELAIAATGAKHVILRTSWVYAEEGKNFLHTMLRLGREREELKIVADQIGAPTTAEAITEATRAVLAKLAPDNPAQDNLSRDNSSQENSDAVGVYHLACAGETSWCGFAEAIFAAFAARQKQPRVIPIPTEAYPTPAKRPGNSRLNCAKFTERFGFAMPHWQAAFADVAASIQRRV
jgi:dTDP-4-dehydrorhamnose reductase